MHKIKRLTKEQNDWLKNYQGATGFEPMHLEELESGEMSFNDAARSNIDWYESHMHDAFHSIDHNVPYDEPSNTACSGLATPSAMDEGLAQNANQ